MKAIDHIVSLHSYEIQVDYMDTSNQRRYSSIADCCTRPNFKMANSSSNSLIFCCLKTLSKIQEVTTFSSFVKRRTQSWQTAAPGLISRWLNLLQTVRFFVVWRLCQVIWFFCSLKKKEKHIFKGLCLNSLLKDSYF